MLKKGEWTDSLSLSFSLIPFLKMLMQSATSLIGGGVASLGATATTVAGLESLVLINKHVFVPAMEYTTKAVWGVFGQDPLRTEQELYYAWKNYIEPVFDFVEGINVALKN